MNINKTKTEKVLKIGKVAIKEGDFFNVEGFHFYLEKNGLDWKEHVEDPVYLFVMSSIKYFLISSTPMKDMKNCINYLSIWFPEYRGDKQEETKQFNLGIITKEEYYKKVVQGEDDDE